MENNFIMTDDMLWDYADDFLAASERRQVDAYLQQHPEWQVRLQAILDEKQDLLAIPLESPDRGFADRVMAAWATEQVAKKANGKDWIVRLILVVFGLFLIAPVIIMVVAALQLSPAETYTLPMPELPAVNWTVLADNPVLQYALLLIFALVGLRFLDKIFQHQRLVHKMELVK